MDRPDISLRRLLSQRGSYPTIAAAVASRQLPRFPVRLFDHVGDVYRRVETAAADDCAVLARLRLAALVHEEPLESIPKLLDAAGLSDFAPTVVAVTRGFGSIWKIRTEDDLRAWVEANSAHLAEILLFEVAHEGRPTVLMERAAAVGGLQSALTSWAARLQRAAFLDRLRTWAEPRDDVRALVVVGSVARGDARPDSDVDVVLLTARPAQYLDGVAWVSEFGATERVELERYGKVTSVRAAYRFGLEVEFGVAGADWASTPFDPGTEEVARNGIVVLFDRDGHATALAEAVK